MRDDMAADHSQESLLASITYRLHEDLPATWRLYADAIRWMEVPVVLASDVEAHLEELDPETFLKLVGRLFDAPITMAEGLRRFCAFGMPRIFEGACRSAGPELPELTRDILTQIVPFAKTIDIDWTSIVCSQIQLRGACLTAKFLDAIVTWKEQDEDFPLAEFLDKLKPAVGSSVTLILALLRGENGERLSEYLASVRVPRDELLCHFARIVADDDHYAYKFAERLELMHFFRPVVVAGCDLRLLAAYLSIAVACYGSARRECERLLCLGPIQRSFRVLCENLEEDIVVSPVADCCRYCGNSVNFPGLFPRLWRSRREELIDSAIHFCPTTEQAAVEFIEFYQSLADPIQPAELNAVLTLLAGWTCPWPMPLTMNFMKFLREAVTDEMADAFVRACCRTLKFDGVALWIDEEIDVATETLVAIASMPLAASVPPTLVASTATFLLKHLGLRMALSRAVTDAIVRFGLRAFPMLSPDAFRPFDQLALDHFENQSLSVEVEDELLDQVSELGEAVLQRFMDAAVRRARGAICMGTPPVRCIVAFQRKCGKPDDVMERMFHNTAPNETIVQCYLECLTAQWFDEAFIELANAVHKT
jgi:hypothetical protein